MQTVRSSRPAPGGSIFTGEGSTMSAEITFRMDRLADEAERERLAAPREGLRHHLGHALIAVGRAIHGLEPEHPAKPAIHAG